MFHIDSQLKWLPRLIHESTRRLTGVLPFYPLIAIDKRRCPSLEPYNQHRWTTDTDPLDDKKLLQDGTRAEISKPTLYTCSENICQANDACGEGVRRGPTKRTRIDGLSYHSNSSQAPLFTRILLDS
jgi:hypothetical protein